MLTVKTNDPSGLLKSIRNGIDNGSISNWKYDKDGDFTHDTPQFNARERIWLRPSEGTGVLSFTVIPQKDKLVETSIYSMYFSAFVQILLTHFGNKFSMVSVKPKVEIKFIDKPKAPTFADFLKTRDKNTGLK